MKAPTRLSLHPHLVFTWLLAAAQGTLVCAASPPSGNGKNPGAVRGSGTITAASADSKPGAEKPFEELIKGAQAIKGLFTLYRKDDKIYLEILPDQFDMMFLCSPTLESGLGERGLLSAQMLEEFV